MLGPPKGTRCLKLGEGRVHLTSELLEDAMRSGSLSTAQDAVNGTGLLQAPSPHVLMVVVVPSWRWRQRREARIALRTVLTRLVPPGALARLAIPAVLTRLITPFLAGVAVVPKATTTASSAAVAAVAALGTAAKAPITDCPELLAVVGVVAVDVMEDVERVAALGGLRVVAVALHLRFSHEHSWALALHVLSLGLLVFRIDLRKL